jgi:hypothetical protein
MSYYMHELPDEFESRSQAASKFPGNAVTNLEIAGGINSSTPVTGSVLIRFDKPPSILRIMPADRERYIDLAKLINSARFEDASQSRALPPGRLNIKSICRSPSP